MRDDFDCEAFVGWLTLLLTFRTLIELDPKQTLNKNWVETSTRAIGAFLEIPEPKNRRKKSG